jgi:NADPH-dependent 2,4-dienoyl-CoA reductase/sulfur reductase-like enzyme
MAKTIIFVRTEENMERERLIVIGGVAAGMSAASRARRLRPDMEILVFEKSRYVSYAACGMPYFIADKVKSAESLVHYDAGFFKEKRNIEVFLHHEVTKIFTDRKTVLVKDIKADREIEYPFDKILISTGARPFVPPITGANMKGIFTLRRLEDGIAIKEYIRRNSPDKGLVLGAGSIGLEMAEAFSVAGLNVTLVEKMPCILGTMDDEIIKIVEEELERNHIRLLKSRSVVELTGDGSSVTGAILDTGEVIDTGTVLIGTGIRPNSEIAKAGGIELGQHGAIKVNRRMETNVPDIYAAGDCAEVYHLILKRNVYLPLGTTANKQGRVAGENIAGGNIDFAGVAGTSVFKAFDIEVGRTGVTEKEARVEGLDYVSGVVQDMSRSRYYPGASTITIKLVADNKTGRLLGAQMVGREGVAKRIDIFATAITKMMTTDEIRNLDLAYAPPFAPVYDPVLIAADQLQKKIEATARNII